MVKLKRRSAEVSRDKAALRAALHGTYQEFAEVLGKEDTLKIIHEWYGTISKDERVFSPKVQDNTKRDTTRKTYSEYEEIREALKGIARIEPRIHRINFAGNEYNRHDLEKLLGPFSVDRTFKEPRSPYLTRYIAWLSQNGDRHRVYIRTNRRSYRGHPNPYPKYMIDLVYPTFQTLLQLSEKHPGLKVAEIECAFDIFTSDPPADVRELKQIVQRYLYVPHGVEAKYYWPYIAPYPDANGAKRFTNSTCLIMGKVTDKGRIKKRKIMQVYERGPDDMKKEYKKELDNGKGWYRRDVDTLRIEFNIYRGKRLKNWLRIDTLEDFLERFSFSSASNKVFAFIRFRKMNSSKVPEDWKLFMTEYLARKEDIKNIHQYTEEVKALIPFKEDLILAAKEFDC